MIIFTPDLPIQISNKCDRDVTRFSDGYEQRASFQPLKSVTLSYLDRPQSLLDSLLIDLDTAGGKPDFTWNFRPHYAGKKWKIKSFRKELFDTNLIAEWFLDLQEYPTQLSVPSSTAEPLLIEPSQSVNISTEYLTRSSNLGKFSDLKKPPVFSQQQKVKFTSFVTWGEADSIDILLDRQRGIYPLIWDGKYYLCPDWTITYLGNDFAEISIDLSETFVP